MSVLRILVAEDSPTARALLVQTLGRDRELEVVGEAADGAEAVARCRQLKPDLVTMDIQMPVLDGVEATRQIMVEHPTPVVMVSSLAASDVRRSILALEAGALAVIEKPVGPGAPRFERDCAELIATIKAMAQVKLVRRWAAVPPYARDREPPTARTAIARRVSAIGLVASTGGPNALRTVLRGLPDAFATPILIVQHIAPGFAAGLADWLRTTTGRPVRLAIDGEPLAPGLVVVAPDHHHLEVDGERVAVTSAPPVEGFRPSGTRLLASLAEQHGANAVGVVLTGMGTDGVAGLRKLRDAGAAVFAQDEASSDIWGMPGAAFKAGVVAETTPLVEIAARLRERAG